MSPAMDREAVAQENLKHCKNWAGQCQVWCGYCGIALLPQSAPARRSPQGEGGWPPSREQIARAMIANIGSPWTWEQMPSEVRGLWLRHADAILAITPEKPQ